MGSYSQAADEAPVDDFSPQIIANAAIFVSARVRFNLSVQLKVISWVVYSHFALWKRQMFLCWANAGHEKKKNRQTLLTQPPIHRGCVSGSEQQLYWGRFGNVRSTAGSIWSDKELQSVGTSWDFVIFAKALLLCRRFERKQKQTYTTAYTPIEE